MNSREMSAAKMECSPFSKANLALGILLRVATATYNKRASIASNLAPAISLGSFFEIQESGFTSAIRYEADRSIDPLDAARGDWKRLCEKFPMCLGGLSVCLCSAITASSLTVCKPTFV